MKKSNGWTIFWLILFFPIGLYRMWQYKQFPKIVRIIISVFFALVVIINMFNKKEETKIDTVTSAKPKEEVKKEETKQEENKQEAVKPITYQINGISIVKPNVKTANVLEVIDGDTIKIKLDDKEETVRMILVDTPETKHPSKPVQPFGPEASDFTKKELSGKQIGLELDAQERDKYGRLLAYVWLDDQLFNGTLLEKGYARVAVFPPNTKYVDQFRKIQDAARNSKTGIWSIENYATDNDFNEDVVKPKQQTAASTPAPQPKQEAKPETKPEVKTQPTPNGSCNIKGNKNSKGEKIYHMPGQQFYDKTNPEEMFCSEAEAKAAGYRKSMR
ncbi:thermonuclease family protein [Bacillus sp. GB_SG_008]|uniref:thermonuclease family protein n=1 Tax=Bacillus sp. GB_SG_008 TaxID=3454627 RepID=UPI003F873AC2